MLYFIEVEFFVKYKVDAQAKTHVGKPALKITATHTFLHHLIALCSLNAFVL